MRLTRPTFGAGAGRVPGGASIIIWCSSGPSWAGRMLSENPLPHGDPAARLHLEDETVLAWADSGGLPLAWAALLGKGRKALNLGRLQGGSRDPDLVPLVEACVSAVARRVADVIGDELDPPIVKTSSTVADAARQTGLLIVTGEGVQPAGARRDLLVPA
jgi:hypothetical protein